MNTNAIYTPENNSTISESVRTEEYYRTTIDGIQFQIYFQQIGNIKYYQIIDKRGNDCVRISMDMGDPERELFMGGLSYKPSCSLDITLPRGNGTVSMIKAALIFAMKMNPELQYIVFSDDSHFDCMIPGESTYISIPLHTHNFIIYGKTWYQRMFGAVPADNGRWTRQIEPSLEELHKPLPDHFHDLWAIHTSTISKRTDGWVFDAKEDMQATFTTMKSNGATCMEYLHAMFSKESLLFKNYGEHVPCSIFYLLMPKLMDMFNVPQFQMTQWKIERTTIESYSEYDSFVVSKNENPSHIKRRNTYKNNSRLSYLFNNISPYYTIGGTRKRTSMHIPGNYGGLHGYLSCPKHERLGRKVTVKHTRKISLQHSN